MKISLKSNWSEQFIYGDDSSGYFAGRREEIDSLKNILQHNNSSSILLSSVRGLGKTSFVHKTVSELKTEAKKQVIPFFLNFSSIQVGSPKNEGKAKTFIKSLILAVARTKEFKENDEIKKLYEESLGNFTLIERGTEEKEESFGVELQKEFNSKLVGTTISIFSTFIGLSLEHTICRYIITGIGLLVSVGIINWKTIRKWTFFSKKESIQTNSFEYLEKEFQKWLESQKDKKILVFVIDELDKVSTEDALKTITLLKNLFSRSFGHFIFIAGKGAYKEVEKGNRGNEEEFEGTYPTLFTHKIYLPLPSSSDLLEYLNEIFQESKNLSEEEKDALQKYLLFKAGNDFFELKKLIFDLVEIDEKGCSYLDIDKIKTFDANYNDIQQLYPYITRTIERFSKRLKKYWFENSEQQDSWFKFLNENINQDFEEKTIDNTTQRLKKYLLRGGIIIQKEFQSYTWTRQYPIDSPTSLYDEEREFLEKYLALNSTGKILNELATGEKNNQQVTEINNTSDITGIDIHSVLLKYQPLEEKLNHLANDTDVRVEESEGAIAEIDRILANIHNDYFNILHRTISKRLQVEGKQEGLDQDTFNIQAILSTIPNLKEALSSSPTIVYCNKSKYTFLIKDLNDYTEINKNWQTINGNSNLLFINVHQGKKSDFGNYRFTEQKEFKNGKKKDINRSMSNFKLAKISKEQDLERIIKEIKEFFVTL